MSSIGRGTLSYRKVDNSQDKPLALGQKQLVFAHKFTSAGLTDIDVTALNAPSEMTALGFINPNASALTAASMYQLRDNLQVISSLNGPLMDYVSYDVISNNIIRLKNGAQSSINEIIVCYLKPVNFNGMIGVDATAIVSTGTLAISATDYVVGQSFQVNKYSSSQVGDVLVYVDGILQHRNTGNATAAPGADGNYQEVPPSAGNLSNTIRFNNANTGSVKNIIVVSNGMMAERPSAAVLGRFDTLASQVDKVIQDLAVVTGNPTSTYQTAPNNIDLAVFGNLVRSYITGVHYDAVVGTSTQVSAGQATHTSIQAAHDSAASGAKILVLQGTYSENLNITKKIFFEGKGHSSSVTGTLTLGSGSSYSAVNMMRFGGNITINSGSNNIFLTCWQATGTTVTNNGTANKVAVSQE
jgi:hypothetical protein